MAIGFTIADLVNDQTSGVQAPSDGNDIDVTLNGTNLDGLDGNFELFLQGLALDSVQKAFAVNADAASLSNLIQITSSPGETMNDLKLVADSSVATNWTTLGDAALYLHVDSTGNYATLTTSGGATYAAFALTGETIDNVANTASAGVQMVTFGPIKHPTNPDADERLMLGSALNVGVDTTRSFGFSQLAAGNFLWAAVGDSRGAMLITGQDLNVVDVGGKQGDKVNSGSTDPTDTVNTSKATDTTIGINAQHFAPTNSGDGAVAVLTFVSGFAPLELSTPQYTGQNIKQIDYNDYINVSSASIFVSQLTGSSLAKIGLSLWEAGGGAPATGQDDDQLTSALKPEMGYADVAGTSFSYIGDQDSDRHLKDDTVVNVGTVTIGGVSWNASETGIAAGILKGTITVSINGNAIVVDGATANDRITLTALDGAGSLDGTFNRIDVQALAGSGSFDIGHIDLASGGLSTGDLGSHLFVDDDGPTMLASTTLPNNLEVANRTDATGHDDSFYTLNPGTDGLKSYTILGGPDTSGAFQWSYANAAHTAINGTFTDIHATIPLYTLVLNADGSYDFDMIGTLPGGTRDLSPAEVIKAGSPDAPTLEVGALNSTDYVLMSAGGGNINESHGYVGVTNGNLDPNESMTFSLHAAGGALLTFQGIQIGAKSAQGGYYSWTAIEHGTGATISSVTNEFAPKNGSIVIDQADLGGAAIDSITVTKVSGPATKIGVSDIHLIIAPDDVQLDFSVELRDGDNDPTVANFTVDIDGDNDGNFDATVNSAATLPFALSVDSALPASLDAQLSQVHHDYLLI